MAAAILVPHSCLSWCSVYQCLWLQCDDDEFDVENVNVLAPFFLVHLSLLAYVYIIGSIHFLTQHVHEVNEYIKSSINITILVFVLVNTYWFLVKRPALYGILKDMKLNEELALRSVVNRKKLTRQLRIIKFIVIIFFTFNYANGIFIYVPSRVSIPNTYSVTSCVGMEPLTSSPNREICYLLLYVQECTIIPVNQTYQALELFLIAHTAVMYRMLSEDISRINLDEHGQPRDLYNVSIKEKLSFIVSRHVLNLGIIKKLNSLYSMPIGVNYGSNAVCICLLFFIPLYEYVNFEPILIYCIMVFTFNCLLGQQLINASEEFERSVYCCGWETFQLSDKKTVYIMLLQSQKTVEILAADIVPVNLDTFARTIQGMYKFITVIKF